MKTIQKTDTEHKDADTMTVTLDSKSCRKLKAMSRRLHKEPEALLGEWLHKLPVKEKGERPRPVSGTGISKELLYTLRLTRERQIERRTACPMWDSSAEIEMWEDLIHAHIREVRYAPREVISLDSATCGALDDIHGPGCSKSTALRDGRLEYRREFALRAIQRVSEAWASWEHAAEMYGAAEWKVELRKMTPAEIEMEAFFRESAIQQNGHD